MSSGVVVLIKLFAASGFLPMKTFAVPGCLSFLFNDRLTFAVRFHLNVILDQIILPFCFLSLVGFLFDFLRHGFGS